MRAGRIARPAARILLLDKGGRALLFRFVPDDRPPFWCTPGGALEPGETHAAAARRELFEETGIRADPGPEVTRRETAFTTLEGVDVWADERYFVVRVHDAAIRTDHHTALERRVMREWRWFAPAEIDTHDEPVFPDDLTAMLALFGSPPGSSAA